MDASCKWCDVCFGVCFNGNCPDCAGDCPREDGEKECDYYETEKSPAGVPDFQPILL